MALTCPNCGNSRSFLVKTLQMHVVQIDGDRIDAAEDGRPGVIECLCDECDATIAFDEVDDALRREILLALGAR